MSSLEKTWANIVHSYSPLKIEFVGTLLVQIFTFWLPSLIYLSLETLFPAFSERHKLQPAPKQPTRAEIFSCLRTVLVNQTISTVLHVLLLNFAPASFRLDATLPSIKEVITHISISLVLREILFYYSHRLLHHPRLYPKIHKLHHKFTAPVALAAQFSHPVEHVLSNIIPITLPPQLLGAHIVTFWLFMGFELLETTTVHSGYDFWAGAAKKHDLHHEKFLIYFGTVGILDWLHGTDGSKSKRRGKGVVVGQNVPEKNVQAVLNNKED